MIRMIHSVIILRDYKSRRAGKAPKTIKRFDKGKILGERDHVHFTDGSALNIDGTWKHGGRKLTKKEIEFLALNGWIIPR
ncbi:MAG: hypothetical protein AAGA02_16055 [Bacteroidota bacterium]